MTKKKIIAVITAFSLAMGMAPENLCSKTAYALAERSATDEAGVMWHYKVEAIDGTEYAADLYSEASGKSALEIPSSLDGYPVYSIGGWTEEKSIGTADVLQSVRVPASVARINDYAFSKKGRLSEIIFETGSRLKAIGNYSFGGDTAFSRMSLPLNRLSISGTAFDGCTSLKREDVATDFIDSGGTKSVEAVIWGDSGQVLIDAPAPDGKVNFNWAGWTKSAEAAESNKIETEFIAVSGSVARYYGLYKKDVNEKFFMLDGTCEESCGTIWFNGSGSLANGGVKVPEPPEVKGYSFTGWIESEGSWETVQYPNGHDYAESDTERWACYSRDVTLILSYDEGDETSETKQVFKTCEEQKNPVFRLPERIKNGHVLDNWLVNDSVYRVGQGVVLERNATAVALWTPNEYRVVFSGGTENVGPITALYNESFYMPNCANKKTVTVKLDAAGGKTSQTTFSTTKIFSGWRIGDKLYSAGEEVKSLTPGGTIYAVAEWKGDSIKLPVAEHESKVFTGWTDGVTVYEADKSYVFDDSVTLTAVWETKESKVTIHLTDSDGKDKTITIDVEKGSKPDGIADIPKKVCIITLDYGKLADAEKITGACKFTGLWTKQGGTGVKYFDENMNAVRKWDLNGNQTLYAGWEPVKLSLPAKSFDGYSYKGWTDGTKLYTKEYDASNDVTLRYVISAQEYEVTLDCKGGKCSESRIKYVHGIAVSLPVPTKDDFVFGGWHDKNGKLYTQIDASATGDIALTAKWEEIAQDKPLAGNKDITHVKVPEGFTEIPDGYFKDCVNLESVKISTGVTFIGKHAFDGCTNLKDVVLPDGLLYIKDFAFKNCTSLPQIKIPDTVTSIGNNAFENCTSLQEVDLPASVETIGADAFKGCTSLKDVWIRNPECVFKGGATTFPAGTILHGWSPSTAEQFAAKYGFQFVALGKASIVKIEDAFSGNRQFYCNGKLPMAISVPTLKGKYKNLTFIGCVLKYDVQGSDFLIPAGSLVYDSNGYLMREDLLAGDELDLTAVWEVEDLEGKQPAKKASRVVCRGVTYQRIGNHAVVKRIAGSKKSVSIPASVSFDGKQLKVTEIASGAAKGCSRLKKVTLGKHVSKIGKNSFRSCKKLTMIKARSKKITVGKNAIKGTGKNLTIRVKKNLRKTYRKAFKGKGNRSYRVR